MHRNAIEDDDPRERRKDRRQVEPYARWLLGLAKDPPFNGLSPDTQQRVGSDVHHYMKMLLGEVPELSMRDIKECHTFIRTCVRTLLNGEPYYTRIEVEYRLSLAEGRPINRVPRGNVNLFKQEILETLSKAKGRLRQCRRKWCPNTFLRTGKQEYCTPRCSGKARLWKYRAKKKPANDPTQH
jgi:hypothetical protein